MKLLAVVFALAVLAGARAETEREERPMESVDYTFPIRSSEREADELKSHISDRASLFFRSLDKDHDKLVSVADARAAPEVLQRFLPGVSADEFAAFVQLADKNGDQKLSRDELSSGLVAGLKDVPEFLEVESLRQGAEGGRGFWDAVRESGKVLVDRALGFRTPQINDGRRGSQLPQQQQQPQQQPLAAQYPQVNQNIQQQNVLAQQIMNRFQGRVDTSQDSCVLCQYVVERAETNVKQAGVIPAMSAGVSSFLEEKVEVKSKDPFDAVGAAIIGSTRQSTRVQRQLERQKYNEIYRVVDITLDDVCEQGMPSAFYGYCKQVYQVQADIVDGLRYQYRPADICFRVGMCGPTSYITRGIHSRYK